MMKENNNVLLGDIIFFR